FVGADELEALAQANPDLMSYDSETGAIRFRSDVTFAIGRADVRETAVPIIGKLAGVLNSPAASEYEVRVVGHTDNVPMRNAANIQRFGDNWGLSTARSVSVMKAFRNAGIEENRMSVAGYGEFRPVEPNGPRGSEANRRVEIYLVLMPSTGGDDDAGSAAPEAPADTVVPMTSPAPPSTLDGGK
ncbi:MAG: OmpA family protein, partial [Planctomycetota bacterium]